MNLGKIASLIAFLAAVVFAFDISIPLGVAGAVPYAAIVLLAVWLRNERWLLVVALLCSALTMLGLYLSPSGGELWKVLTNRGLALAVIWCVFAIGLIRLRGEERLKASETYKRLILDTVYNGIILTDDKGTVNAFNPSAEKMFEYSAAEVLGHNVKMLMPEANRGTHDGHVDTYLRTGKSTIIGVGREVEGRRKDGATFPIEIKINQAFLGKKRMFISTMLDITERKEAEGKLRQAHDELEERVKERTAQLELSESRLLEAQRIAKIGCWQWDIREDEVWWSDENYRFFGVDREQGPLRRDDFFKMLHPGDRQRVRDAQKRALAGIEPYSDSFRIGMPDESEKIASVHAEVIVDDEGYPLRMVGTTQDITEARQLGEQLQQAQKMEMVGQLTGGIAHDFNNLLMVILGNLQLAEESSKQDESLHAFVQAALDAGFKGAELTKRLLSFSRRQQSTTKVTDVNRLVTEIEPLLKRTLRADIVLETKLAEGLWLIEVDISQMENSLVNLAVNARDAMPAGGTLTIRTSNVTVDEAYAGSHAEVAPGEYVLVAVSDTGTGMPKDVQKKILEPFFTTKEVGKGTGLGLSMVYGFVTGSKGHIDIESEEGRGTTFKLYLPRSRL